MKVDILGTEYTIEYRSITEDPKLDGIDGYHDSSVNLIVIAEMQREKNSKKDLKAYQKQVLRHEIIHAFLYQSGLDNCSSVYGGAWAESEEMVDWFAIQAPKIFKAFQDANCI